MSYTSPCSPVTRACMARFHTQYPTLRESPGCPLTRTGGMVPAPHISPGTSASAHPLSTAHTQRPHRWLASVAHAVPPHGVLWPALRTAGSATRTAPRPICARVSESQTSSVLTCFHSRLSTRSDRGPSLCGYLLSDLITRSRCSFIHPTPRSVPNQHY